VKKFPFIAGVITLAIAIIVGGVFLFSKNSSQDSGFQPPDSYEYYWGDGCPHCTNVQAFFDTWDKKDQIDILKLEVWSNPANARLMRERAKNCEINPSGMGVPFLVTPEGKCLTGDESIIDHFKSL